LKLHLHLLDLEKNNILRINLLENSAPTNNPPLTLYQ
jgi:hypothetical protein